MGVAASKNTKKKKKKDPKDKTGPKKSKKQKLSKSRNNGDTEDEEVSLIDMDAKPDVLRKQISKLAKTIAEKREKIKPQVKPMLAERRGLQSMLEHEREKLMKFVEQKTELEGERLALMSTCWNEDADELYECLESRKLEDLVLICATRTKWQLVEISTIFFEKYHDTLQSRLVTENQYIIGKLFTGSISYLVKLLVYRTMPQNERDAAFIRDFTAGMSLQSENLMEIVLTRSNAELKDAMKWFVEEYDLDLKTLMMKHPYKNFREFMTGILDCNRDEFNEPFDEDIAIQLADEVYKAGAGRTIGVDASVFIRVFSTINKEQFDSLNEKYKGKALFKDIDTKLGGDFAKAVKIRCTDKHEYLAARLASTLKSRFSSADKDLVCRIFGCCARWEGPKIKEAYDKGGHGRTLEASLKVHCSSEPLLLKALMLMISGDNTLSPLGSDREQGEDESEATRAGRRARLAATEKYNKKSVIAKGTELLKQNKSSVGIMFGDADDDDIPNFAIISAYRSNDIVDLTTGLRKAESVLEAINSLKDNLMDEIQSLKESYWAIISHCYETETWLSILRNHVKNIKAFNSRRSSAAAVK